MAAWKTSVSRHLSMSLPPRLGVKTSSICKWMILRGLVVRTWKRKSLPSFRAISRMTSKRICPMVKKLVGKVPAGKVTSHSKRFNRLRAMLNRISTKMMLVLSRTTISKPSLTHKKSNSIVLSPVMSKSLTPMRLLLNLSHKVSPIIRDMTHRSRH